MQVTNYFFRQMLFLFLAIFLIGAVLSIWGGKKYQESLLASYKDKLSSLEVCNEPKTVFIGGSSVLFGTNAELYSQLTGRPSINMGLQALKSYDIYFSTISERLNPGDTVILALEYNAYQYDWHSFDDVGLDLAWLCNY